MKSPLFFYDRWYSTFTAVIFPRNAVTSFKVLGYAFSAHKVAGSAFSADTTENANILLRNFGNIADIVDKKRR